MLTALALTVLIEAALAFLLKVRTLYGQAVVLLSNLITNPILNAILTAVSFYVSPTAYYVLIAPLEAVVVFVEGRIFGKMLDTKLNPYLFSLILNAGSLIIGTAITKIFK